MSISPEQRPLLGILGGMGPLATADFISKLTRAHPAKCDRDHLPWVTLSQPGIPDRSLSIQNGNDAPLTYLVKGVAWLAAQDVTQIVIPCNSSHYWYDSMQAASPVPIVHIADATLHELKEASPPDAGPVAVFATRGTMLGGIYTKRLAAAGYDVLEPNEEEQGKVDGIIRAVKAGEVNSARGEMQLLEAAFRKKGARMTILGCTELPIAHDRRDPELAVIDSSLALAREVLRRFGYLADN